MNNFTVCNNRYARPTVWQNRITSLTERMKTYTPPGKFMMLALLCLLITGNVAAQSRVQYATGSTGNSANSSFTVSLRPVTVGPAPAAGNTLIAVITTRGTTAKRVKSITQNNVTTWTRVVEGTNSNGSTTEIWYAPVTSVSEAGTTVTITLEQSFYAAAVVMEYNGLLNSNTVDQTAYSSGYNKNPSTGVTSTTTLDKELWIGGIGFVNNSESLNNNTNSFSTLTSVSTGDNTAANNTRLYLLEKKVTTVGTASTGGTFLNNRYWSGAIATFKTVQLDIIGPTDVCQGSTGKVYTVPTIGGATSYVWTYKGTGATLNGTLNTKTTTTNSVTIDFGSTATTGFLNVTGRNGSTVLNSSPNLAIQVNSTPPNPIREIITPENCPGDKDGAIKLKLPTALIFDGPIPGVTKEVSNLDGNPIYNDGVNLNASFLNNLTGFTVEGWVNTGVTIGNVALFGQNNVVEMGFLNNRVELYSKGIKSGNCLTNIEYPIDGKWHHIAGTGDYYRMKIYIDGIEQRDWVYNIGDRVTNYGTSTYLTRIGRQVFDDTDLQPFTGQIMKVGFWNRALSQAEITALAGGGFHDYTTADAGLIAGYNFYETTGDITLEPVSNPSAVSTAIPMGTLVNTPRWNEVYNYTWVKTDVVTDTAPYGGAATKNIKLIERGDYNVTVASKFGCGSNSATFTVTGKNRYWTGAISTDWSNPDNWICGVVKEGYSVEFATPTNNPLKPASKNLELLDGNHTINNLTNATALATIIPPAKALTVQGKVYGSDTDPNKILIQANDTQYNGSLIFADPTKNPTVKATVQMYTRGYKGTDMWTWTDPAGGKYSGYYRWQFFGVPVNSTDILYNNTSLWGSYIRKYEEREKLNSYYQKWTNVGNNDKLTAFTGYEITQPAAKAISFQGELVTGDRTLTLTKSTGTGTLNYGSGYNIFGNSFTAAIDISKIKFPDTGVEKTVYLYNTGSLADWGNNGQTLQAEGGTGFVGSYYSIPQNTSPVIGKEIPSMQGFLLKTTTNGAQVTIPYSTATGISATPNTTLQRTKQAAPASGEFSYMTVDVTGAGGVDRVWLFSQPETSHRFDNGWDGEKILLATGVVLYADEESGKYQVNTAADLGETYLAFRAGNESDYTLKVDKKNLNGYETLYLQDLMTGTEINLSAVDTASYQFMASNGQNAEKRFVLTRRSKTAIDNDRESLLTIYSAGNSILLNNRSDAAGVAGVYDLTGKQLYSATYQPKQLKRLDLNLPEGVYMVKAKSEGVNAVRRILIGGKR